MDFQLFTSTLLAGVAAFVATAFIVADIARATLDISLLVGIPAGIVIGGIVAGVVSLSGKSSPERASLLSSLVLGFAAGALLTYVIGTAAMSLEPERAVFLGVLVGVGFAVLTGIRARSTSSATIDDSDR